MKKTLRQQICDNMNLKETDELLDIWHEHNIDAWREEAFEIIKEILLKRLGEIPAASRKRPSQELLDTIEAYIDKIKLRKALQECDLALERFPDSAELYNLRGLTYDLWDNTDKALENYHKALDLDPENEDAKKNLADLEKEIGERDDEVWENVQYYAEDDEVFTVQKAESAVFYSLELAEKHYRQGLAFDEDDELENALESYRKALQLDPGHDPAFENLDILEEALEDKFYETDFFEKLDRILELFYEGQKERALDICNELKAGLPPISSAHNELGLVFEEIEALDEAQSLYEKACQLNPRLVAAFTNWRNINEKLEALLYEMPPVDQGSFMHFDDDGNWQGLIEPLPGWVYNNANAYFLRGTPGHRNLPGKSGLDPIETYAERARVEGIMIRSLLTFRFRTHNPVYLFSMAVLGFFMSIPLLYGVLAFGLGDSAAVGAVTITSLIWVLGPFLLINVFLSLVSSKPEYEEDDGSAFF